MRLKVNVPTNCPAEVDYIFAVIFGEFLGVEYDINCEQRQDMEIIAENRSLELPFTFFSLADSYWLSNESLPKKNTKMWDASQYKIFDNLLHTSIPVIFGDSISLISSRKIKLGIDIFGSAFFMLSRYEEVVTPNRDVHDRFPANMSFSFQEGFLSRPIINEYVEVLWRCMKYLWPGMQRKQRKFQLRVTADVDQPYACGIKNPIRQFKQICGDLLKRNDAKRALNSAINYFTSKSGNYSLDPYYSKFDWMMSINEKYGNNIDFYFIAGHSEPNLDGCYSLDEPVIRKLLRRINDRGHMIGLHPSYNTYKDPGKLCIEADNLRRVMKEESIHQEELGGRQHYLRWDTAITAKNWDYAGLDYDSTLSFAEHAGFRCGICFEYTLYDVIHRKTLKVKERPLIVMERSIIDEVYMNHGHTRKSFELMKEYKDICKYYGGDFVLLWHNSYFDNSQDSIIYSELIK